MLVNWLPLAFVETPLAIAAVAGGALSIPLIIHLLNRRRFKVVTWAAMRFLLAAQKKNARRMRLEQLLLLALRCLLVLLLVLAMASITPWAEAIWRWFAPEGANALVAGSPRTHKILVIDGSFSMGLRNEAGTCFERARDLAAQIVRESSGGDSFSIVLMAEPPRRIVPEPSEDARKVLAEIANLHVTHGNADLAATLNTVESLVRASPGKYLAREVYFLTDLQQSTWIARQPATLSAILQKIQERAQTIFIDVGRDDAGNLAVTNLVLDESMAITGRITPIVATLTNYGDTRSDVPVRLFVGKATAAADKAYDLHEVEEKTIKQIKRGEAAPVTFTYKFPTPGDYVLVVQTAHDDLELDDRRSAVVTVKNTVPVLLVNGKPALEAFDRASEWLRVALNPYDEGTAPPTVAARPKVVSLSQFADEGLGDLTPYDCVFLCDVPRFSLAEVRRLENHVRRGGSAVFCLGPNVDLAAYNDVLYRDGKGLLPARLIDYAKANSGYEFQLTMDADADREDPLKPFRSESAREYLLAARFRQFIQTEPVSHAGPRRVLSFTPVAIPGQPKTSPPSGGPAILDWRPPASPQAERRNGRMRGRVVLITTTVNADWNNWPSSPSFAPLMQELLYYASAARLREQALQVGEPIELYLSNVVGGAQAIIHAPDGRTEATRLESQDEAAVLRWSDTDISGVYSVVIGQHPQQYLFAVNVPVLNEAQQLSESDLTRTTREDLQKTYPEWAIQVVTSLSQVRHAAPAPGEPERLQMPLGDFVARWLLLLVLVLLVAEIVLAWRFGHYSAAVMPLEDSGQPSPRTKAAWVLFVLPWLLLSCVLGIAGILIHDAVTGDFLAFLPDSGRRFLEGVTGIEAPAPGESSHWRLEYRPYLWDNHADPWLAVLLALGMAALVYAIYAREGSQILRRRDTGGRFLRLSLRLGVLFLMLAVLLPRARIWFERQSWPDLVLLLDDSQSMSTVDQYKDTRIKQAVERLAQKADLTNAERLSLAQALLTDRRDADPTDRRDWLTTLLTQRKVRVHVYHCSSRAHRLKDVTTLDEVPPALEAINSLRAEPHNDSSQLGRAVRQVLNDFRGSSLAAVVMFTDGVTTEGEDLVKVAKYAQQMGVPLFFVGIGDAQEVQDLYLHDLTAPDSAYVHDRLIFTVNVTAQGYNRLSVPVMLREKGQNKILDKKTVHFDGTNKTVKVILTHQPTEPGEKVYVIDTPVQEDEAVIENNHLQRAVFIHESRQIKVLYVEGYRRWEYHYIKTLLERESSRIKGNKSIDLKVLLLDADPQFASQDRSALSEFPTKAELNEFDVVLLGDVDPQSKFDGKMPEHLKDLADFVRERGGGLLMIAGERYAPNAYKDSPLKDVLPIDVTTDRVPDDEDITDSYRPLLTPMGRTHQIFQFSPGDERENEAIWNRLREMYWHASGYQPKRAAEVLAVLPKKAGARGRADRTNAGGGAEGQPLVVQQFVGAGRTMFLGFCETWRWNWREDQAYFNRFWIETVRYLARARLGHIELRLDRQTPYRRGEPIKMTVRFPDDAPPPPPDLEVKVTVERRNPAKPGDSEVRTVQLPKVEGSRATYETLLTQTPEGEYKFWLASPSATPKPHAECQVVRPPGEMERLRMNQADLERAAEESHGRFYTLADADNLLDDLPTGTRVTVNAPGPPYVLWNHFALFMLTLGLLTTEWLLRKQKNLL